MALAMLWASRIINNRNSFSEVPRGLREKVKEILIDSGCEHLVTE